MPVARSWERLMRLRDRELDNARLEEQRYRRSLRIHGKIQYHVGMMHKTPPETKQEAEKRQKIEQGKAQPDYHKNEEARRRRDKHDDAMQDALNNDYRFEELFGFADPKTGDGHLFPKPPPRPTKEDKAAYYDRLDKQGTQNVVTMLQKVAQARKEARERKHRS